MPIKSRTEASPDEQQYQTRLYNHDNNRFVFVITGQTMEILNYHFSPITQHRLSFFLIFAVCLGFFLHHLCTRPQIISIIEKIQVSEVPALLRSQRTQDKKKGKETDAIVLLKASTFRHLIN